MFVMLVYVLILVPLILAEVSVSCTDAFTELSVLLVSARPRIIPVVAAGQVYKVARAAWLTETNDAFLNVFAIFLLS